MFRLFPVFVLLAVCNCGEILFSDYFSDEKSIDSWVQSTYNGDKQGEFKISAGTSPVDPVDDLGLMTIQDAKFYGITKKLDTPITNDGKTLVVQFTVKYTRNVECGGAYLKLIGSEVNAKEFHGESPYKIMFGPDICGMSKKVHVIFNYKDKNHLIKKEIRCKDDLKTHLYTLIITPDNKYIVKIDNVVLEEGLLENDWDMLLPKTINDPSVTKPADWEDEEEIDDQNDKKPADWDQPKKISDESAKKPNDWDDEMDGEWSPPQIDNPMYKGEWSPKRISNPKYKGAWVPPKIANPEYTSDDKLYLIKDIAQVGFDLWQVTSGSIFDNIFITDSVDLAEEEGKRIWKKRFEAEEIQEKAKEEEDKKSSEPKVEGDDTETDDKPLDDEDHDEL